MAIAAHRFPEPAPRPPRHMSGGRCRHCAVAKAVLCEGGTTGRTGGRAMRKLLTVLAALMTLSLTNCGYNAIQTNDE
ncbi:MAG: hypothetical protein ACK46T_38160, partial [Bradyrhizobium sp.]